MLAINGGTPELDGVSLPSINNAAGRTIGPEEEEAVLRVLRSGMLSGVWGTEVTALQTEFAEVMGTGHAVASTSGTAALHLAVAAVDPAPYDEIIVPPITDMGTVLPVIAQNAVPVFADLEPATGCLDPEDVKRKITSRTRAIIVVHLFGAAAKVAELRSIADETAIVLIEDCAQSYLATERPGSPVVGTIGHLGCFSLQQSKHITTGDGGLTITDDEAMARNMRLFADKAWPRDNGRRSYLGFALNYRMPELSAAVAREQLRKLPAIVDRRIHAAEVLTSAIADLPGLRVPHSDGKHVYWTYTFQLERMDRAGLRHYAAALAAEGVPAGAGYLQRVLYAEPALRSPEAYGGSGFPIKGVAEYPDGLCPVAESLIDHHLIVIPWNESFTDGQAQLFGTAIRKVHQELIVE